MTVDAAMANRFRDRAEASGLVDVAVTSMDTPDRHAAPHGHPQGPRQDRVRRARIATRCSARSRRSCRRESSSRRAGSTRHAASSTITSQGRIHDFRSPDIDWTLVGPFARRVLRRTARIPYGSVASYGDVAAEIGTPRAARARRQRARFEPDPRGGSVPPGRPYRRRDRWLRRRAAAQALAARPRGRLSAGYQPGGGSLRLRSRTKSSARATASQRREKKSWVIIRLSAIEVTVTAH